MSNELEQKKLFTRRAVLLGVCKAGLVAGLFGRMVYLQILKNREFLQLSENNRIKTEVIPPLRGRILDRYNIPLALNQQSYQLIFTKTEEHDPTLIQQIALKIGDILNSSPKQQANIINTLTDINIGESNIIAEHLQWDQLVSLELHLYDLPGVNVEVGFTRFYPYKDICSHITGYVGTISDKEMLKYAVTLYPDLKIGKNGIEKTQEKFLRGITGLKRIEVNAKGQAIRQISTSKSIIGRDVALTLDIGLQQKTINLLGDTTGVVLVQKLSTGEILAMVSQPSFDPNLFNDGISQNDWSKLINNSELPLINRAVALTYPPGSGFKLNVAIAALQQGFNPETKFFCPGHYVLGDRVFRCWKKDGHGTVNLCQAIAGSCNVYFWNTAKIIGMQPIARIARQLGFGSKLLHTLPREQAGLIPDPNWKKEIIGTNWQLADTINAAIGQGYVDATPLQILTMAARIATGKAVKPIILKSQITKQDFETLDLEQELHIVRRGMEMAANSNIGTAYLNRIIDPNLAMAGKTGTSQVISKRHANDDLSKANVEKKIKNHGIFIAYAPFTRPEYAFCGIIEHGGTPALAVKIARDVLIEAQLKKI